MERTCLAVPCKPNIIFLSALLQLLCFWASAQDFTSYTPLRDDSLLLANMLRATSAKLENDKANAVGENKKYIAKEYQERFDYLKKMYEHKEFVTDARASAYLTSLLNIITKANPALLSLKPNVLFSKVFWPNAASFGEGTLVFNISLFNRLTTEAQAAFILCHELSHLYLDHSNKAIQRYVNTVYSKDFQAELKDINKYEYGKTQRLKGLAKAISFKSRRHSRDHETEADSMALELMKNTGFDVRESLTALTLLDSVDQEKYAKQLYLERQLSFVDYPFQPRWIRAKSISLGEAMGITEKTDEEDIDSLKTHPDCTARVKRLQPKAAAFYKPGQQAYLVSKPYFDTLVYQFDRERIAYCYKEEQVGRALFYSLQMFSSNPNDAFLATMIGRCFNKIYTAQQQHFFGRITDLPSGLKEKTEYDVFLQFLQSLRLAEVGTINYKFMQQQEQKFKNDAAFMKEYNMSKSIFSTIYN